MIINQMTRTKRRSQSKKRMMSKKRIMSKMKVFKRPAKMEKKNLMIILRMSRQFLKKPKSKQSQNQRRRANNQKQL